MKKKFIILLIIVVGGIIYVVATLRSGVELNEPSPLAQMQDITPVFNDALDTMDDETMKQFMAEVKKMSGKTMETEDVISEKAALLASGEFKPRFHSVKGQALLINEGEDKVIRFEDFETDNGPNLHIYLASDLGANDFIDLGKIRATKGSVNYRLDSSIDTDRYNKVLVWCVPFGVLFSYAILE